MNDFSELENAIGYHFNDVTLLNQALTHSSYAHEKNMEDYERLEFLGDAILDYIVAQLLYDHFPDKREGEMTKMRAGLVKEDTLAEMSDRFNLISYLRVSAGKQTHPIVQSKRVKCNIFEAVIGAISIDSNNNLVFLKSLIKDLLQPYLNKDTKDYKSLVLEFFAQNNIPFQFIFTGTVNQKAPEYFVVLQVKGKNVTTGSGKTKKSAEQDACKKYYRKIFQK